MNMRFSIVADLDEERLRCALLNYFEHTPENKGYKPYIFMNSQTVKQLMHQNQSIFPINSEQRVKSYDERIREAGCGVVGKYEGYNVFVNDELSYGEVEIR